MYLLILFLLCVIISTAIVCIFLARLRNENISILHTWMNHFCKMFLVGAVLSILIIFIEFLLVDVIKINSPMFHQEVMNHKSEYMPPTAKEDEDTQPPVRLHRSGGGGGGIYPPMGGRSGGPSVSGGGGGVRHDIIDDDTAFDEIQRMLERITGNKSKK